MNTYELINPSDAIQFDAESDQIACAAAAAVGQGMYAAHAVDDGHDVGGMALFGDDSDLKARLGGDIGAYFAANTPAIRAALRSFRYVTRRTSMSRIVDAAHNLGAE